jgi:DHA1 family inner membrane transport protein
VTSYGLLVACIIVGGFACGALTTASYAEVSLRVDDRQRGRALGWLMSGQSMTLLIAVPIAAWLGASIGWRGVHFLVGGLALAAMLMLILTTRAATLAAEGQSAGNARRMTLRAALNGAIVRLFIALIIERVCFGLAVFYYPAYLRTTYDVGIEAVALPLFAFALGNIVGTILGGQLADRFPYRRVSFGVTLLIAGAFAVPWFTWHPGLIWTAALGVGFSFFDALARPSLMAAFAAVPAEVRGVIMGLNSSVASVGWLTAAMVGGWLFAQGGFGSFGPLISALCLTGALVVLKDSRSRHRPA